MNDPAVRLALLETCAVGVIFALLAWLLYFATSIDEPERFSVFPPSKLAWSGYWMRTVLLNAICSLFLFTVRRIHPMVETVALGAVLLLLLSSVLFFRHRRGLCMLGLLLTVGSVGYAFLFPRIVE